MIERNARKKQKEQNPAHPATSGRSGSPAQKRRSGTKKAGTSKSNANRILPILTERKALGSLSKSYGFKTKSLTRMSSYAMAGRNGQPDNFLARCKSATPGNGATCPATHSTICTRDISKLTSGKSGKYHCLFLYIGRSRHQQLTTIIYQQNSILLDIPSDTRYRYCELLSGVCVGKIHNDMTM